MAREPRDEDPANPGQIVPHLPPTPVPFPHYYVSPPAAANNPPQLVAEVQAPEPAESPELYGDAQWTRVFEVQLPQVVTLDQLVADNPNVVPMQLAQLEADYQIIQDEPAGNRNGNRRLHRHVIDIAPTTRSVVRRIETYAFTGGYDPITHEALCADGTCNLPAADELGDLISVQMTAATVVPDAVLVSKTGSGSVDSADRGIACGNKCAASYTAGQLVTLTVKPASGSVFQGWTGACAAAATATTCTVAANGQVNVGAAFVVAPLGGGGGGGGGGTTYSLSVSTSQPGTVTSSVGGINCGTACSASYAPGTVVTLTAIPPAGKSFLNWGDACSGAQPTCTLTMSAAKKARAFFSK